MSNLHKIKMLVFKLWVALIWLLTFFIGNTLICCKYGVTCGFWLGLVCALYMLTNMMMAALLVIFGPMMIKEVASGMDKKSEIADAKEKDGE